jgi:hypothetical protein
MNGHCLCGSVSVEVAERPNYLNLCNCGACTRLGAMWGYFRPGDVQIDGAPASYVRADMHPPELSFHFCGTCGSTTHWSAVDPASDRMAVNMRLFDAADLYGLEVRYGDKQRSEETGTAQYYRAPTTFGEAGAAA